MLYSTNYDVKSLDFNYQVHVCEACTHSMTFGMNSFLEFKHGGIVIWFVRLSERVLSATTWCHCYRAEEVTRLVQNYDDKLYVFGELRRKGPMRPNGVDPRNLNRVGGFGLLGFRFRIMQYMYVGIEE